MDPFSIATSILAVLQAANAVISVCYTIKATSKDLPRTITSIISEIQELRNVLETLDRLSSEEPTPDSDSSLKQRRSFEILSDPYGPLALCLQELKILESLIESYSGNSGSKARTLVQAVKWQYGGDEIRLSLKRIDRIKSTLNLAITADSAVLLFSIQEMTSSLAEAVDSMATELVNVVQGVQIRELDEKHRKILHWLSPVGPTGSHEAATKMHQAGTNDWFVKGENFKNWQAAKCSFLWLSGFPGAGKTILFSSTVTHLKQQTDKGQENDLMAVFYCDFRRKETQNLVNVMGSLVSQLCSQSGVFPTDLEDAYQHTRNTHDRPSVQLLRQLLEDFAARSRVTLLIDALDECLQREEVAEFISELTTKASLRMLLTSRDEPELQSGLDQFVRVRIEAHLVEVSVDIKSYIDHRLTSEKRLQWLQETPFDSLREEIATQLIEKASGMFRWVQCQIDTIGKLRTVRAIRAAMQELPPGLDETYDNILSKIATSDMEIARRILLWVAFAAMPLTLREVREGIAIDQSLDYLDIESSLREEQDILDLCGSLVVASEDGYIGLAHLSVKDYLLSERTKQKQSVSAYALEPDKANQELARNCLAYLCFREFSSGPCQASEAYTERLNRLPLATYAAVSFSYFVRGATTMTPDLEARITGFFAPPCSPIFMSWVQVLNAINGSWDFYPNPTTTLYYASTFGLTEAVKALIVHPDIMSSLNAPGSRFGGTALHGAVLREHLIVLKLLLEAGADPNQADWNFICPLHTAAGYGNIDVIEMLLEYGAKLDALDYEGKSPKDWAIRGAHPLAMTLLSTSSDRPAPRRSASSFDLHSETASPEPGDALLMTRRGTQTSISRISFLNQNKAAR